MTAPSTITQVAEHIEQRIALHTRAFDADTPMQDRSRRRAEAKIAELNHLLAYLAPAVEREYAERMGIAAEDSDEARWKVPTLAGDGGA